MGLETDGKAGGVEVNCTADARVCLAVAVFTPPKAAKLGTDMFQFVLFLISELWLSHEASVFLVASICREQAPVSLNLRLMGRPPVCFLLHRTEIQIDSFLSRVTNLFWLSASWNQNA